MDPNFIALLYRVMNTYFMSTAGILTENAFKTAKMGTLAADLSIGIRSNDQYYSQIAQSFADRYSYDLTIRGGSKVYDQSSDGYVFKPWLSEAKESTRQQISDIINEGIKAGKPPGVKESGMGTYPKGTIAYDINEVMDGKKSWASMVARTEGANITNDSRLSQLKSRGVERVRVWDNEGPHSCSRCGSVNQQIWAIDFAMEHMLEHPNCVRRFQAIIKGITITAKAEEVLDYHPILIRARKGLLT